MSRLPPAVRIALLVIVVVALGLAAQQSGLAAALSRERIAAAASAWGAAGVVAYVALFAVGEVLQLPGALFVVAAVAAYGPMWGMAAAYLGMNVASMAVFAFGRGIAGRALAEVKSPRVAAVVAQVERAPIRTAMLARGVLFVLPGIGYALALSPIRFRDYVVGSAIGIVVPTLLTGWLGEWALRILGAS